MSVLSMAHTNWKKRDLSPRRKHNMSEWKFERYLFYSTFAKVDGRAVGPHGFKVENEDTWNTYQDIYNAFPLDFREDSDTGEPRPVFEVLAEALMYRNLTTLALDVVQRAKVNPKKLMAGLFVVGSLAYYREVTASLTKDELEQVEKENNETVFTPVYSMELYLHFKVWDGFRELIEERGHCDLLSLVFNIWNCFTLRSELYCQFLIDKFNEKKETGELAYADTFALSAGIRCRRWGYACTEGKKWGHPKALELIRLINEHEVTSRK